MRVLITGGAGYVGCQLARKLLDDLDHVTILDTFAHGYAPIMHLAHQRACTLLPGDIRAITHEQVKGFDVVYHLAAISGYPACEADPAAAWDVNVNGTERLCDALDPDQRLVYASTTSIYGPPTLYARSKEAAERIVMERQCSVAIRWATLFGIGPAMRHELLPNAFTRQAVIHRRVDLYSPEQRRTYMHVRDAASIYASITEAHVGEVWNVGDPGLTCSKAELAGLIQQATDCEVHVIDSPDEDARDIEVDFGPAALCGLGKRTSWPAHIDGLVRFYRAAWEAER